MQLQGRILDAAPRVDTLALVQRIWNWPGLKMHHKGLFIWLAEQREGESLPALVPMTIGRLAEGIGAAPRTVERWLKDLVEAGLLRVFERHGDGGTTWELLNPNDRRLSRVVEDSSGARPLFDKYSEPNAPPTAAVLRVAHGEGATNLTSDLTPGMTSEVAERPSLKAAFLRQQGAAPDLTSNLAPKMAPAHGRGPGHPHPPAGARATKDQETKSKSPTHQEPNQPSYQDPLRHHPTARNVGPLAAAAVLPDLAEQWGTAWSVSEPDRRREVEAIVAEIREVIGEGWLVGEFRAACLDGVLTPGLLREALEQFAAWRQRGGRPGNPATAFRGIVERMSGRSFVRRGAWRESAFPNGSHPQRE